MMNGWQQVTRLTPLEAGGNVRAITKSKLCGIVVPCHRTSSRTPSPAADRFLAPLLTRCPASRMVVPLLMAENVLKSFFTLPPAQLQPANVVEEFEDELDQEAIVLGEVAADDGVAGGTSSDMTTTTMMSTLLRPLYQLRLPTLS
eukprot:scpid80838/ scgid2119/ 